MQQCTRLLVMLLFSKHPIKITDVLSVQYTNNIGHGMTPLTRCTLGQWRARSQPPPKKNTTNVRVYSSVQACCWRCCLWYIPKKELLSFSEWGRVARYDNRVRGSPKWKLTAAVLCSRDTWYTQEKTVWYEVRTNNIGHGMTRHTRGTYVQ